ncbi:hypothetical protein [Micromonospora zamorensis]|uniref:hypothetical protein n=1 Tax=Micromonospora zamorensis TaxID=709883 RepID=UPI003CE9D283
MSALGLLRRFPHPSTGSVDEPVIGVGLLPRTEVGQVCEQHEDRVTDSKRE